MTEPIAVDTLRQWLDESRPVTVIDIRSDREHAELSIPGSVHAQAYEALQRGQLGPLASISLPAGRPVIVVCGAGRTSQTAADLLAERGVDAHSLAGGMKAWSLAWNTAEVQLRDSSLRVIQVRRVGKGCLSYVVGSAGEALVIDPSLPSDVYRDIARQHGWLIRHVLDTHIHADHVSRARSLARESGATLDLPEQRRVRFHFNPVADRDRIKVGAATCTAHRTPGHTEESMCYVLNDDAAVFTGDTLFVRGVGRPDLKGDGAVRHRASALFSSLTWLRSLSPDAIVLPAHTGAPLPFDGRPEAARMRDVDGWLSEWIHSEQIFIDRLVSSLPPTPPNFIRIVELNEGGELPSGALTELEAGANRCAVT